MKALLGTKIGMTQVVSKDGVMKPITLIQAGPVTVTQIKTIEKDGYNAVQVAFGKGKNLSKAVVGHLKNVDISPKYIKEFRLPDDFSETFTIGQELDVNIFELGEIVDVTGTSKGKGFAGNVKRHNFNTSKHTHGGWGYVRKPGSIGSMYPQRIFKGKRMAGRMGHQQVTVKNLSIELIDRENNLLGVCGAVPGPKKSLVMIGGLK